MKTNNVIMSKLIPNGYRMQHVPRIGSRGGGVALIWKAHYAVKLEPAFQASSFESIVMLATIGSKAFRIVVIYRPPPSQQNQLQKSLFVTEFADLLEQAATWTGQLLILGDFNVHWDVEGDTEKKQFEDLLEAFSMIQHLEGPTHSRGHTLDLVMSHADDDTVASCSTSHFISDHNAISVRLNTGRAHPPRKMISSCKLRSIQIPALADDVSSSSLAAALPDDVDEAVEVYNTVLSELLDKHAPLKTRSVAVRTPQPWMNDEIKEMKRLRRKYETLSKKYKHKSEHRRDYRKYCIIVRSLIVKAKEQYIMNKINRCQGDQKSLFNIVNSLLGRGKPTDLPRLQSPAALAEAFKEFFVNKIILIRTLLENMEPTMSPLSVDLQSAMCRSANKLEEFTLCSTEEVEKVIRGSSKASCQLDPIPTNILCELPSLLPIITKIVNLSLSAGHFPTQLKSAIVKPLLKKSTLEPDIFKNFRPVSNLSFVSKVIEKVIAAQLLQHMKENNLLDKMQSAYKSGHSTETALLRVHNDIMMAVDKGKHVFLVLLDLSAAFDTVDHEILLVFLKEHVGLSGSVLRMFESYLQGRSQCISINNILSTLSHLVFGVPQGSVLRPIIFCTYTLPLGAILRSHKMLYHIYADDTQLYCTFDADSSTDALARVEACIRDIRSWMIANKLKINDDKTEFLAISSSRSSVKLDSSLTIGNESISQSASCRNLGTSCLTSMQIWTPKSPVYAEVHTFIYVTFKRYVIS